MKLFAVVMTMGALMGSVCAQGQEGGREGRPGAPGRGATTTPAKGAEALLSALDRNRDGKLQQEEIDLAVVVLRRMDRDKDGTVSSDEMVAPPQGQGQRPGLAGQGGQSRWLPTFDQFDKDGDGHISKEEAPERMKERFEQMDTNGDGVLDKAEQDEIVKRLRDQVGRQGGNQRPGQNNQGGERRPQVEPSGGEKPKRPAQAE